MFAKKDEIKPEFSFEGAHLYRNVKTNQYIIAAKLKSHHLKQIKQLDYLKSSIQGQYTMTGDYIILQNGRLSFVYGQSQFSNDHVLVR